LSDEKKSALEKKWQSYIGKYPLRNSNKPDTQKADEQTSQQSEKKIAMTEVSFSDSVGPTIPPGADEHEAVPGDSISEEITSTQPNALSSVEKAEDHGDFNTKLDLSKEKKESEAPATAQGEDNTWENNSAEAVLNDSLETPPTHSSHALLRERDICAPAFVDSNEQAAQSRQTAVNAKFNPETLLSDLPALQSNIGNVPADFNLDEVQGFNFSKEIESITQTAEIKEPIKDFDKASKEEKKAEVLAQVKEKIEQATKSGKEMISPEEISNELGETITEIRTALRDLAEEGVVARQPETFTLRVA